MPPTKLPEKMASTIRVLFEQGLPDPRGCEYRTIHIVIGSVWSNEGIDMETRGWVLPDLAASPKNELPAAGRRAFAICWNGLVYPVVKIGDKADLDADVRALLSTKPGHVFISRHEESRASPKPLSPIKICLLLRLGKVEEAEHLWETTKMDVSDTDGDPYLAFAAEDWAWSLFDRACCARLRSDDRLALIDLRHLSALRRAIDDEAERRHLPRPAADEPPVELDADGNPKPQPPPPKLSYIEWLESLPQLLADQERRLLDPTTRPAVEIGLDQFKDKPRRIATLIRDLENIAMPQAGQPGGVPLGSDATVQALVQQGEDAIEPLIECLESDPRLTRSVHFGRDFSQYRSVIGVHEAAYVALVGILNSSFFEVESTADDLSSRGETGRRAVAKAIRAFCKKYQGVPLMERWYLMLADDDAMPKVWVEAA